MTAPDPADPRPIDLAFVSCQNYEQGFFGAWARMLNEDANQLAERRIQFVLHLGDFIYERYSNRAARGQRFVRRLPDFPDGASDGDRVWADSLDDYRHLYKTYLTDPHLQAARANWPFICTWDDHEFSNDGFQHFSFYGDEPLAERQRQLNAHRAWFEYIPTLVPAPDPQLRIYRSLRWGKLGEILLTDLRSYRSPHPVPEALMDELGMPLKPIELVDIYDGGRGYNGGNPPEILPFGGGTHPNTAIESEPGSLLGATQKIWFKERLSASDARWKIWGNSLPILPFRLDLGSILLGGRHESVLGTDAWNGYPGEYRELMQHLEAERITGVVSLSGDHHMQAAGTLVGDPDREDTPALAVDFNITGISSTPHFMNVLHSAQQDHGGFMQLVAREEDGELRATWDLSLKQGVLAALAYDRTGSTMLAGWLGPNRVNPGLAYMDTDTNGYGLARFDAHGCQVDLVTIEPPLSETGRAGSSLLRRARFDVAHWNAGEEPTLSGPVFSGEPPLGW
jgi:alkaline phosphatase D